MTEEHILTSMKLPESLKAVKGGVNFLYGQSETSRIFICRILTACLRSKGNCTSCCPPRTKLIIFVTSKGEISQSRFVIPINVTED